MKVISVISQKGGAGKTTLSTALAVQASRDGKKTVMFDLDPQATATFWQDIRADDTLAITAIPASRLGHVLKAVREAGCDMAVIDTPPFAKEIAYEAAQHADFVLIPTRPAVFDIQGAIRTFDVVREFGRPHAVVLNCCPPVGREIDDAEAAVKGLGATLCPIRIGQRIAYSRAQQTGLVAQEVEPDGKAAQEIKQLYEYVCMNLYGDELKQVAHG